jgi:hypothetical protein
MTVAKQLWKSHGDNRVALDRSEAILIILENLKSKRDERDE